MAFDEGLAQRIREAIGERSDLSERKMFGGLSFLIKGKMAVGVIGREMIARLSAEDGARALQEEGVRPMDFTGKPMKGWVYVGERAIDDDDALRGWVSRGLALAESLSDK